MVPEPDVVECQRRQRRRRTAYVARARGVAAVQCRGAPPAAAPRRRPGPARRRLRPPAAGRRRGRRRPSPRRALPAATGRPAPVGCPFLAVQHRRLHRGRIRVAGRRVRLLTADQQTAGSTTAQTVSLHKLFRGCISVQHFCSVGSILGRMHSIGARFACC